MDYLKVNEEKLRDLCQRGLQNSYKLKLKELNISLTNKCNNYCIMCHACSEKYENRTYNNEIPSEVTLFQYKKLFSNSFFSKLLFKEKIKNLNFVFSTAESLLNKNIYEIVKYTKNKYHASFIRFISNGTIPPKPESIVKYIDKMSFSIDGCTNETFHYLRPPATLDHVINVIKKWDDAASQYNDNLQIGFGVVVSSRNIHELAGIVKLASQYNHIESVYMQPIILHESKQHLNYLLLQNVDDDTLEKEINNVEKVSIETGVRVDNLLSIKRERQKISIKDNRNHSRYCRYMWNGILTLNGNALDGICCYMENRGRNLIKAYNILSKGNPYKIYNSKGFWKLRKDLLDGKLEEYCKNCEMRETGYKLLREKETSEDELFYV